MSENDETMESKVVGAIDADQGACSDPEPVVEAADESAETKTDIEPVPLTPDQIEDLKKRAAQSDEYLDLLKRARADFANFQKRVGEDRRRWAAQAQREVLSGLLSAADQCRVAAEKSAKSKRLRLWGQTVAPRSSFWPVMAGVGIGLICCVLFS